MIRYDVLDALMKRHGQINTQSLLVSMKYPRDLTLDETRRLQAELEPLNDELTYVVRVQRLLRLEGWPIDYGNDRE